MQITGRISTTGWPGYKSPVKVSKSFSENQWALRDLRASLLFVLSFFADGALSMLAISDIHNKHMHVYSTTSLNLSVSTSWLFLITRFSVASFPHVTQAP